MKNSVLTFLLMFLILFVSNADSQQLKRDQKSIVDDKTFSVGESQDFIYNETNNLRVRVIKPIPSKGSSESSNFPAVIVIHGGGWQVNGGDTFDGQILTLAKESFVKRGYVVASVEYRLMPKMNGCNINNGFKQSLAKLKGSPYGARVPNQTALGVEAYRAAQDSREAIKYVFDNASKMSIDTQNIFVLGQSAGAYNALHSLFLDDEDMRPYQVAVETEGTLAPKQLLKGVIAMSGGVFDLNFIDTDEKTPLLLTYFSTDLVVPSNSQKILPLCTLPTLLDPLPISHGSDSIIQKMRRINNVSEFLRINGAGHVGSDANTNKRLEERIIKFLNDTRQN